MWYEYIIMSVSMFSVLQVFYALEAHLDNDIQFQIDMLVALKLLKRDLEYRSNRCCVEDKGI